MVLRLLVLKHIRNWSYEILEREVRAHLVYREFTHVGAGKAPDAKTMGRWDVALGPQVLKQVHEGVVRIARDKGIAVGRRLRVDTTVVETDIHHPTDSTLLGDGVRVAPHRACATPRSSADGVPARRFPGAGEAKSRRIAVHGETNWNRTWEAGRPSSSAGARGR